MIARISGTLKEKGTSSVLLDIGGLTYEIFIPQIILARLDEQIGPDRTVNLVTYHYLHVEPSRSIPVLIGFLNEVEKEFFEAFITVSGIGPKAALRALNQPISLIARAIDEGNVEFLKSLPGIGGQRAKEIVAKLQHKIGKFGLIQDQAATAAGRQQPNLPIEEEALAVLLQLQYKRQEALTMIRKALEQCAGIRTTEDLLNEVYKQKRVI